MAAHSSNALLGYDRGAFLFECPSGLIGSQFALTRFLRELRGRYANVYPSALSSDLTKSPTSIQHRTLPSTSGTPTKPYQGSWGKSARTQREAKCRRNIRSELTGGTPKLKSLFNRLQERAKLWSLKETFSGGSNYSGTRPTTYCEACDAWHPVFDHGWPCWHNRLGKPLVSKAAPPGSIQIRRKGSK